MKTIFDKISNFFQDLYEFSNKRHLLLTTVAKGETAPLAADLAEKEREGALEMVKYLGVLKKDFGDQVLSNLGDLGYLEELILGGLVFGLKQAKEFLRRDVLADAIAVALFDIDVHNAQLEEATRLSYKVNKLLKLPELANITPASDVPPWMGTAERKKDATLQLYASKKLSDKQESMLKSLETDEANVNKKQKPKNGKKP